jgi:hypothetical protein
MDEPFCIYQDIYLIGSAGMSHPYDCCVYESYLRQLKEGLD